MANFRLGDIGATISMSLVDETNTALDISLATLLQFRMARPDGTSLVVTPSFVNSGTDGLLTYDTVSGDLNQVGIWQIQARVTLDAQHDYHSDVSRFQVDGNL